MVKLPLQTVLSMLSMEERDVRYVLTQTRVLEEGAKFLEVEDGPLMVLLVYDLLSALKFSERDILSLLFMMSFDLTCIGASCGAQHKKNYLLSIADNRYVSISGEAKGKMYDFKDLAWLEQIPQPVVSFVIVLPELFQRAVGSLESPSGRLLSKEEKPNPA